METPYREIIAKNPEKKIIGFKQCLRLLAEDKVRLVILAEDSDDHIKSRVTALCEEHGVSVISAAGMEELGRLAEIEVSAAVVSILK